MGGETKLEDPLSFEAKLELQQGDSVGKLIAYTTINWVNTNRVGMTFGVLFGAALLTFIGQMKRRSFRNGFANTLMGFVVGTPLGVCVNCSAPVAKGMHDAGARLETTLATMFSSPTMNIVVLTMVFSIFPLYMALIKLGATLIFILVLVPLLCRYVFKLETQATESAVCNVMQANLLQDTSESWLKALGSALLSYLKNLWHIVYTTVPLMLLAGFLGAVFVTLMPLQSFAQVEYSLIGLIMIALVGTFLPVPIAFDVVFASAMMAAGLPVGYAMALLFTLGCFSVYPLLIVWRSISRRVALTMFVVVASVGVVSALVADWYHGREIARMYRILDQQSSATPQSIPETILNALVTPAQAADMPLNKANISFQPFERAASTTKTFTRHEGEAWGLAYPNNFNVGDMWPPFYYGRGVASGDIQNDGWQDILFAVENGVLLYFNEKGKRFSAQKIDIPALSRLNAFIPALVDLNNDGWLDIYVATYQQGNYYVLSEKGKFTSKNFRKVPVSGAITTLGLAFSDLDRDGDLDAAMGNWFYGWPKEVPPAISENYLLLNDKASFTPKPMGDITGETLSMLFSDINNDGNQDLLVGNDFVQPDIFYFGDGKGGFKEIARADGLVPISTNTTMSMDTADIDNDLDLDIYIAQIAAGTSGTNARLRSRTHDHYCDDIAAGAHKTACEKNMRTRKFYQFDSRHKPSDIENCAEIEDHAEQNTCKSMMVMKTALATRNPALCDRIPDKQERPKMLCKNFFVAGVATSRAEYQRSIPQHQNQNVLLVRGETGAYQDTAGKMGVAIGGWSWNAKFADLDNDEWQDIYLVNGAIRREQVPTNLFFKNEQGGNFSEKTSAFGLENFMVVSAYTYVDIDNDGDLDIVTNSLNGPAWVYINNVSTNKSVAFELRDHKGNRFGVGSKIIITYGEDKKRHQIREIKSGGGFVSFDAPIAYFGLGKYDEIGSVEVVWSTGERSKLEGPFKTGGRYVITRQTN